MRKRRDKRSGAFFRGMVMGVMAGSVLFHVHTFRTVFERPSKKWKRTKYDCALVCGCPANLNGSPSAVMRTRVERAVKLWREGKVQKILFTGGRVKNPHIESKIMKDYAVALGVPKELIVTETESVSTYHNMMKSKGLMEEKGLHSCAVVTNGWHLRKANHYAKKFGLDYVMCAADEPDNAGFVKMLWRYVTINLHMYLNLYRGLY